MPARGTGRSAKSNERPDLSDAWVRGISMLPGHTSPRVTGNNLSAGDEQTGQARSPDTDHE
jgi:hypothetical protein